MKEVFKTDMFIDGLLFAILAWFIYNQTYFGGDEAAKYISPKFKFWMTWVIGSIATVAGAVKTFRSQAYARHVEKKNGNTQPFVKSDITNP